MASSLAISSCEPALDGAWERHRSGRPGARIAYVTAGYPDAAASLDLRAAGAYADIVEVGAPFSDPVADGPTIQRAAFHALAGGMTLAGTLRLIPEAALDRPVVLFVYLVARLGVTGASPSLAGDLAASVARVRTATPLAVAVGFGISTPGQSRAAGRVADGVARFLSALRAALAPGAAA